MFLKIVLKPVFIIALVAVAMIGVMVPNVFAAEQDTQITFKRSHASIYYGETITFSGSLKDGLGYALSHEKIVIWDKDTLNYEFVASTRTDARGNYEVSVTAEYWDGQGGQAELIAHFSGNGFNKEAVTKSTYVNVNVPRNTYSEPEHVRTITNDQSSYLSLEVMKGSESNTFRVKSSLYDLAGNNIPHSSISVYANNQYKGSVTAGQWSHSMSCDPGNNLIKISANQFQYGVITYSASNDSEYFTCKSTSNSISSSGSSDNKDLDGDANITEKQQQAKIIQLEAEQKAQEAKIAQLEAEQQQAKIIQLEAEQKAQEAKIAQLEAEQNGGCLIATATYGSEMAPQVQQLRELRDNQLLQTESGTAFMATFNDIYYTFSPIIADYERENPYFKEAVKLAITPMISTLSLMENANSESEVLGIGISVIALNLGMYLGVPAIVVIGIRKRI